LGGGKKTATGVQNDTRKTKTTCRRKEKSRKKKGPKGFQKQQTGTKKKCGGHGSGGKNITPRDDAA